MSDAQSGVGVKIYKGDGTSSETFTAIAEVTNLGGPTMTKEQIEVTSLDSTGGYREYIPGFRDGGEVTLSMNFTRAGYILLKAAFDGETTDNYKITVPSPNAITFDFAAFISNLSAPNATPDGAIAAEVTLKVDGQVTYESGVVTT
jgi:predicted secreted protein